jgi:hypothetical protein
MTLKNGMAWPEIKDDGADADAGVIGKGTRHLSLTEALVSSILKSVVFMKPL